MRLILDARHDDDVQYAAQLGCDGIVARLDADETSFSAAAYARLLALKSKAEAYDLRLEGVASMPWRMCYKWMLGLPGRDEQIENAQLFIRSLGAVGIPMMAFNMHALRFFRTSCVSLERGGAQVSSFDWEQVKDAPLMTGGPGVDPNLIPAENRRPLSDQEMWDNYTYFIKAVVPVAEEAGVKLALHPDDPQVPSIGGVARIMRTPEALRRALEIVPSANLGLKFCVGCFSQMGAHVVDEIHHFGSRGRIFLVDFRNVRGRVDRFQESFLDNGQEDMVAVMQALVDVGYDGPIGPDHAVHLIGDSAGGERYWAYAIGYMRALLQALPVAR